MMPEDQNAELIESFFEQMIESSNNPTTVYFNDDDMEESKKNDSSDKNERIDYTQWLKRGRHTFIPTDNSKTVRILEPGFYNLRMNQSIGFYLFKKDLKLDDLIDLSSPETIEVLDGIKTFWNRKDKFKEYGFAYKRGILLYGPPGSGKTSLINLLCFDLIEKMNGVIFTISSRSDLELYSAYIPEIFRIIEPDRPIITVIEDIDGLCESHGAETELINLLDGIEQLENVVYIATTNYAEKLNNRILNRPNRFDRRILVGYPTEEVRKKYIQFKVKAGDITEEELNKWVKETKGMTISHIGELIKSVIILGNNFEETISLLRKLSYTPQSHDYNKSDYSEKVPSSIGFLISSGGGVGKHSQ